MQIKPLRTYSGIQIQIATSDLVIVTMHGTVTAVHADAKLEQFCEILQGMPNPKWVIDQLQMTGFAPGAVVAGGRWFRAFKERGGRDLAIVSELPAARMAASSLAFASSVSVVTFTNRAKALNHCMTQSHSERAAS